MRKHSFLAILAIFFVTVLFCSFLGCVQTTDCNHSLIYHDAVEATCTYDGNIDYWTCENCGKIFADSEGKNEITLAQTIVIVKGHTFADGQCTVCGIKEPTKGLAYQINSDGKSYSVIGIGTATDNDIVIADIYEGLPVTRIERKAFYNTSINSVSIPNSVTIIESNAFCDCSNLTNVSIGDGVKNIGLNAFNNCTNLMDVYFDGDIISWCNILFQFTNSNPMTYAKKLYINDKLLQGKLIIPNNGISSIKDDTFYNCSDLTSIVIPDSVTSIGSSAFENCSSLVSVTIGNSVSSIGGYAFDDCNSLTDVYYTGDLVDWCNISFGSYSANPMCYAENLYIDGELLREELIIPNGVINIKDYTFYNFNNLKSIVIPNNVTSIGISAFCHCTRLTSIVIPDSVTSIGISAFSSCSSLTSIIIPDSVISIKSSAFRDCIGLTIYCEAASEPSGWGNEWNYSNCPVVWDYNNNDIAEDGYQYIVIDGLKYGIKDNIAKVVAGCNYEGNIVIPSSIEYVGVTYKVTSIGSYAFYDSGLISIIIPDSVTSVGDYAFENCTNLTSIIIPDSVKSIGELAFENCTSLMSITIPISITILEVGVFANCSNLTSIVIPDKVTSIGIDAFYNCSSLTNVTIGNSVTRIGYYAFANCSNLTSIVIPNKVTTINGWAFENCDSLIIYCETASQPSGWENNWNISNCPVVWGYTSLNQL